MEPSMLLAAQVRVVKLSISVKLEKEEPLLSSFNMLPIQSPDTFATMTDYGKIWKLCASGDEQNCRSLM